MPLYNKDTARRDRIVDAVLSTPVTPRDTFQPRLAWAVYEIDPHCTERELWQIAATDLELRHRVNALHAWMCGLKFGDLAGIIGQQLGKDEVRHA